MGGATGTLLGIRETNMGTSTTITRPDGSLFGEGQGVMAAVFEYETDASGKTQPRAYEWK